MKRALLAVAGAAALALCVFAALAAADVVRWESALAAGDARYRVEPERAGLWTPSDLAPVRVGEGLLGLADDLEFRRAMRAVRISRLTSAYVTEPRLAIMRSEAQARLTALLDGTGDPSRRSAAANILGVMALISVGGRSYDQVEILKSAVSYFARAIELDPGNEDAKYNLELSYQRGRELQISEAIGPAPTPGGKGSEGAGAGEPG